MSVTPNNGRLSAAVAALPSGTVPVGLGLIVNGLSTYGFQIIAFRALGAEPYAALNGLWVTAFILAPGFFLPLEQEVARAIAHRRARGEGNRPLIGKALVLGGLLVVGVISVIVVLRGPIEEHLLRSSDDLFLALVAVLIGFALMSLTRGILSGSGRFGRYGLVVGMDGFFRAALAAVLALVGYSTLGWFGLIFALAPFVAVVVGLAGTKRLAEPGPSARMTELSSAIGWLLVGSTFSQALGYSAYVGASLLATSSQNAELGAFIAALFIARVPILLFQAVQAALLPRLASLLSAGHVREFIDGFSRLLLLVVGLSVVAIALALVVGPTFGTLLFGTSFVTSGVQLAALTTGCCLVVVALTLAQALIALRRYALPAVSWAVGFGVFLAILIPTSGSVFTRAEIAFVAGAAIATVLMALATIIGIRGVSGSGKVAA